ncbi:MAG: transketolase [Anaerolineae bacterium]|nr:transketolase [Anaerolineae bacterium]
MEEGTRDLGKLSQLAGHMRRTIVEITTKAGSGHPSTSLSMVELLLPLYFGGVLRHDPLNPRWPDRDRFILSKGHGAPALYTVLAMRGYFPEADLSTLRVIGSALEGHPNMLRVPGVEASTGSLGQGLSLGVGHALAGRLDGRDYRTYVTVGDGESQEGQVWEAAMAASKFGLGNLVCILDHNEYQQTGAVRGVMPIEPVNDRWSAFGWHVIEIDGHDLGAVFAAYDEARTIKGQPTLIHAHTVKGKGVRAIEQDEKQSHYHGVPLSPDEARVALEELA